MSGKRLVIVNPNAARMGTASNRRSLVRELEGVLERLDGTAPEVVETAGQAETGPAVAAGLAAGITGVVGVGGDGTLRDIAGALAGSSVPLGVVPTGTGNQLAAVLGIPLSPERAVHALERARARPIDLGRVTLRSAHAAESSTVFTIGCGAGFDARVMATTPVAWKRRLGRMAYYLQGLRSALRIGVLPYRLRVDDRVIETEASLALIGNMGQLIPGLLGPRLPIEPDDGLLDLIVVGARGPLQGLQGLADQLLRTSLGGGSGSYSLRLRGRRISVETDRPEPLEVDGDYVGDGSLEARIVPAALEVLAPAA